MTHALLVIIQTFPADPVPVHPLGMLFQDNVDDVMVGMLQEDHQIMFHFLPANRAFIFFHWDPFPEDLFDPFRAWNIA